LLTHTHALLVISHFHKLPGGLAEGVDMSIGFVAEAGLSATLNSVVLYSLGEVQGGSRRRLAGEQQQAAVD
jgi:hypothetical protein